MTHWFGKTVDGNIVSESHHNWDEVKDDLMELGMRLDSGKVVELPRNFPYIQAKTASADLNGDNIQIESRYIGVKLGNNTVRVRVDEKTQNISIEVD